jgi:malate synthase
LFEIDAYTLSVDRNHYTHNVQYTHIFVGAFFDYGIWVHNYYETDHPLNQEGPYLYIPKLESHLEARLWNDIFNFTEVTYNRPKGTIKAIVHIENVLAAFEMEEILYELREHCLGLNTGRWDYVFSFIKKFRHRKDFVTPDRAEITMEQTFLATWEKLLVDTCKKRGGIATGGMAPQLVPKDLNPHQLSVLRQQVSSFIYISFKSC